MAINFFQAKHKHNMYKIHLHANMLGLDDERDDRFILKKGCEFCKWVSKWLMNDYQSIPEVKRIMEIHEGIHQNAKIIIINKKSNYDKAKREYEKIEKQTKTLFTLLDRIKSEIELYNETSHS